MQGALLMLIVSALCFTGENKNHSRNQCPEVQVKGNFSLRQYMGKWYEIESFSSPFVSGKCIVKTYILKEDGWVDLITDMILNNGSFQQYKGVLLPSNLNVTATLQYKSGLPLQSLPLFEELSFVPYHVLSTDYTSYSLIYSCFPRGRSFWHHVEYAWILSRQQHLPENETQSLYEILNKYNIPSEELIKVNQEGCS